MKIRKRLPASGRRDVPSLSRRAWFGLVGLASPLLVSAQTRAPAVTRGPWLTVPTPTSMTLRWRTNVATDSLVRYGTSPTELTLSATEATSVTEHSVTLTGLTPDTQYYYSVGSSTTVLAGGTSAFGFITSPLAGSTRPTRLWVIGDAGTGFPEQTAVRDAYAAYTGSTPTHLWLQLGDNAYDSGLDSEYQARMFKVYGAMLRSSPVQATIGNHDTAQSTTAAASIAYFKAFDAPSAGQAGGVASGSKNYYSFDLGNIHIVCLDSMASSRSPTGAMLTWLKADLAANTRDWTIAYWHHVPYTDGSHLSDNPSEVEIFDMRANALPILENLGVDLVLGGHSHVYERTCLLAGHYGLSNTLTAAMKLNAGNGRLDGTGAYVKPLGVSSRQGTVYVVCGSSGGPDPANLKHPAMVFSASVAGSMVIDVAGNQLDARFLSQTGAVLDYFTIQKSAVVPPPPPPPPANVAPTVALTAPTANSTFRSPAAITLTAAASDTDGSITKVEFYNGRTRLATDTAAPYLFTWTGVRRGTYTLTAKAYDNTGAVTTSAPVTITVR